MSKRPNIAIVAALLAVLAAPAHANNGDIGLPDRGLEASWSRQLSSTNALARQSLNTRRPRNSDSSSSTSDFI